MKHSDNIANLSKSLAAFQVEIKNPKNCAKNPQYDSKYAPLQEILTLVRPVLGKHGLSVIQEACGELESIKITTLLTHESGEWLETEPFILKGEQSIKGGGKVLNIQGAGSMITYARRYQINAILGLSAEDDDDGNAASKMQPKNKNNVEEKPIDQLKLDSLKERMQAAEVTENTILESYSLEKLEDMTIPLFMTVMNRLEKTIQKKQPKQKEEDFGF